MRGTMSVIEAAKRLGMSYAQVHRRIVACQLDALKSREGRWLVSVESVEDLRTQLAAEKPPASPALPLAFEDQRLLDDLQEEIGESLEQFHVLGVQREAILRALDGSAREALAQDQPRRHEVLLDIINGLRSARYVWTGNAWRCDIPAWGVHADSQPVDEAGRPLDRTPA